MRKFTLVGALAALLLTVIVGTGCHPGDVDGIADLDIVATFYSEDAPFGTYMTYAMDDTIYNLAVLEDPSLNDDLDRRNQDVVYAQIRSEMDKLGYAEVDTGTGEDLRIGLGAVTVEGRLLYSYYPWWGYSPGYWYPSWGSIDYTQGTLQIFMADWGNRDPDTGEIDPVWTGSCVGILENSSNASRLESMITQAFAQSPYLKAATPAKSTAEVLR
jgi:hypothetical protein